MLRAHFCTNTQYFLTFSNLSAAFSLKSIGYYCRDVFLNQLRNILNKQQRQSFRVCQSRYLMSLRFCCNIVVLVLEFGTNNMKYDSSTIPAAAGVVRNIFLAQLQRHLSIIANHVDPLKTRVQHPLIATFIMITHLVTKLISSFTGVYDRLIPIQCLYRHQEESYISLLILCSLLSEDRRMKYLHNYIYQFNYIKLYLYGPKSHTVRKNTP